MAMFIGNFTDVNPNPNATTYTVAHSQNGGSDKFLYVEIAISGTYTISSVTFAGASMTQLDTNLVAGSVNVRLYRYYLASPTSGSNNIVVTFNTTYTTTLVLYAQSFTGCSGISDSSFTNLANAPHNDTMSVSTNDVLFGSGISLYAISRINIDGVDTYSPNFTTNGSVEGDRYTGQISGLLTAGTSNVTTDTGASVFQVTNQWVLFGEGGAPPVTRRRMWVN